MANGTLADHLYELSRNDGSSLTWSQRLKICIGAGRGLDYLHTGCSIIHRDIKSTNILLDENFTAKVSDFGLAKTNILASHVSASVKGSFGYFDPSYFTTGRLTMASDTYAFGVVLLEVLTGRPAIGQRLAENELCMTMWAQERIRNGNADQIVDPNLRGEIISKDCLEAFVGVVMKCLHYESKKRLTMTKVVAKLIKLADEQPERKGTTTAQKLQSWLFWNRVIPSAGSAEKDQNEVEVDKLPQTMPAIEEEEEEDAVENKQRVDMQSIAVRADHIVYKLTIDIPAFPLAEIKDITENFSDEYLIAKASGGGSVFHGILKSGQDVAIKKLYKELVDHEFITEVSRISRIKHENVVELIGYCLDGGLGVLVYEFAPRGSLHDILHGQQGIKGLDLGTSPALSWAQRVKIAVGIATGLCYIHEKNLVHPNIKSSNVLLFDNEIAKLTNLHQSSERNKKYLGCSCKVPYCDEHPDLLIRYDYHPPEYAWSWGLTQKGDVYYFGVVLLELLTGEKPLDLTRRVGLRNMVSWAKPKLNLDEVHKIVDARLKADYPPKAVEKMAAVAALCLQYDAEYRPDMSIVLQALKPILPKSQQSQS